MAINTRNLFACIVAMLAMTGCNGGKTASDDTASAEGVEGQTQNTDEDEDGEWRLVSLREGHETKVYGNSSLDYVLSLSDEDMTFDFYVNNDTVEGEYKVVNDTIRFYSIDEREVNDQVLKILSDTDCYACQDNDSIIITLSEDSEAIFTRIKG